MSKDAARARSGPTGRASTMKSPPRSSPSWRPAVCPGSSLGARRRRKRRSPCRRTPPPPCYSGINVLILWGSVIEHGFPGQSWLTFRQALGLGGNVRKGEHGTTVVYADRFIPDDERTGAGDRRGSASDPVSETLHGLQPSTMRGPARRAAAARRRPSPAWLSPNRGADPGDRRGSRIRGNRAFSPAQDFVQVPPPQPISRRSIGTGRRFTTRSRKWRASSSEPRSLRFLRLEKVCLRGAGRR